MRYILLLIVFFLFFSCQMEEKDNLVKIKYKRFEQALFSINSENVHEKIKKIRLDFGTFNEFFEARIMHKGLVNDIDYADNLLMFIQHPDMLEAGDSVAHVFKDISDIENDLNIAFSNFHYYFPDYDLPEITTYFGGFNYGVITYDKNIAIGLEHFLGYKSKFYRLLQNPEYICFQKQRKFISANVMEVWYNENFYSPREKDFLSQLIHKGKIMVFIDYMLPKKNLSDKFRFSANHMKWANDNELNIWRYFIENDLLYSNSEKDFRSFINYAPFSKGMSRDSPARIGYFIGYNIVKSYMKYNNITIDELVEEEDVSKILNKSRYKPKR